MRYKKNNKFMIMGFAVFIICIMGISMVSIAFANEVEVGKSDLVFPDKITLDNDVIVSEGFKKSNFFSELINNLFGGAEQSFVSKVVVDTISECDKKLIINPMFYYAPGNDVQAGGSCSLGDYIVFKSAGGDIDEGAYIFSNAWQRTSDSDLVNFNDYYTSSLDFTYSYGCYVCQSEPTNIATPVKLLSAQMSKDEYEVGTLIKLQGVAYIYEDVSRGVIETSLKESGGAVISSFSTIVAESNPDQGVCGDDITTGTTFSANLGDRIAYTLFMSAIKPGRYTITVVSADECGSNRIDTMTTSFNIVEKDIDDPINPAVCGDGICEVGEEACVSDCDTGLGDEYCGDGICNNGETYALCFLDCEDGSGCSDPDSFDCWGEECGDGICEVGESCSEDCGTPPKPSTCGDGKCDTGESCVLDCGTPPIVDVCGDKFCGVDENCELDCENGVNYCLDSKGNDICELDTENPVLLYVVIGIVLLALIGIFYYVNRK